MFEITAQNAADYLRTGGRAASDEPIDVSELAGGVSNVVLRVTLPSRGQQFVLKQARGRLRVKEEWICSVERIWREIDVLRICSRLLEASTAGLRAQNEELPKALLPEVLWEDHENFAYAMSAAPLEHKTWKQLLLAGETQISRPLAASCGRLLGLLHAGSWADQDLAFRLDDRTYFDQLRLDPYYRHTARIHPDLSSVIRQLIDSVWRTRRCLVHGDYSPKNLLVWPGHVMLIDFEVGHYGDPAFDLGFFLSHLVLKSIWAGGRRREYLELATAFWRTYQSAMESSIAIDELASLELRMVQNLSACLLARIDGKSPVDYLSLEQQRRVRDLARHWLVDPPCTWNQAAALTADY